MLSLINTAVVLATAVLLKTINSNGYRKKIYGKVHADICEYENYTYLCEPILMQAKKHQ